MLIKSPLQEKKIKPNRRRAAGAGKKKKLHSPAGFKVFKGSVTDGNAPSNKRIHKTPKSKKKLPVITPWKVILASFLIGVCGLMYLSHVFSTQQLLREVQQLELEYNRAKRLYDEKRLVYDRMIGPKEIYQKAQENGFVNAGPADKVLEIED